MGVWTGFQLAITFATSALRELCSIVTKAKRELGETAAAVLIRRVADLRAASTICDLVAGNPTQLEVPTDWSIGLADGFLLHIRCAERNPPLDAHGNIDWTYVSRFKVMGVSKNG